MNNDTARLDPFDAAVMAFEIRFGRDLATIWDDHESKTHSAIDAAPVKEKYLAFRQFFEHVEDDIALVVHRCFPSLLEVAIANRERLAGQSPLEWTHARIMTQVCKFLGLDEVFDPASVPRTDSRLLASAERVATGKMWLDDDPSETFVLPQWTEIPHPVDALWSLQSLEAQARHYAQIESGKLSRAETLEWAKRVEFWFHKRIEQQFEDEMWDGVIESGKTGVSVLDPVGGEHAFVRADTQIGVSANKQTKSTFAKEGDTWLIVFRGEECRLSSRLGLDYIAVILQGAGKKIGALELQRLVSGIPRSGHYELALKSIEDDGHGEASEEDYHSVNKRDFAPDEMVDAIARRKLEEELKNHEKNIAYYLEIGAAEKAATLKDEHRQIDSYLKASFNKHGHSRSFSGENEKARQSVTKRLKDAYEVIRARAPRTADHLESKIKKGSTFVYLDSSMSWNIHR